MRTNSEIEKEMYFKKKFTVLLFELTKDKHKINGFVNIDKKNEAFGHCVYSFEFFNFKNDYLTIFNNVQHHVILEDVKAQSDFCIYFRHIGNADGLDIKLIKHTENFVEMLFFTTRENFTWNDNRNMMFLDEEVIYDVEEIETKDGFSYKRTVKPKYAYLFE